MLFILLLPHLILMSFVAGKYEEVKAEKIAEFETDRKYEVKTFWCGFWKR
ncbi:hypothetical protein Asulf_01450 [Archaeoglobus sulfaticallidus PM70-1]|uniref:Uncharacterized protein n=1 Tax=Archaeoglobus sulfaticallidus PM70-1 TaxID=387631 RepID=N0BEJ2_9EURY|nr:hypothetical protein [Archaeoglobus sulfaticallidus]AGK61433.1 hypothetical protein Asulf_01450 [Archaeoglobus sulfaticallidus PM70-1]